MIRSLALLLLVSACASEEPPAPKPTGPARADVTLKDVTMRQYKGADLRVVATTPRLELMRGSNDFTATDAGVLLKRSGVTVLAQQVSGNGIAQTATGSNGVLFLGNDGTVGRTEYATYDRALAAEGAAFTDAGVAIDHPRFELTSLGFYADFAEQKVTFDRPLTKTKE